MLMLPGAHGSLRLDGIPDGRLGEILSPAQVAPQAAPGDVLRAALRHPIGSRPLAELAVPGEQILIIVDDVTRTTPAHLAAPVVLAELAAAGCRPEDVTFAVALGTHRRMTGAEISTKLGAEIAGHFPVINDPADDAEKFADTGLTFASGEPVSVHRAVLAADLVIAIGSVVPHTEAGWSGGCKMVLPGMCSEATVMANHRLAATYPGNALGQEATPVRRNMEEIVARIGRVFSLNLVVTPYGQVVAASAGDLVAAQRAAVSQARPVFTVPYRTRAAVVVANAYPSDLDFWQASKAIASGELLVRPGGTVILHAACPDGAGPHPEFLHYLQTAPARLAADLAAGRLADPTAAGIALPVTRMLEHLALIVVSPGLEAGPFTRGPIRFCDDLPQAIAIGLAQADEPARVSILTHGGYTYPVPAVAEGGVSLQITP
ncbi:MAG TPA: nickel-dependent lactate racemase [Anaerolineae bacterium]